MFSIPNPTARHPLTLLSIGEGLVSQIPALIISISAGLLVTKAGPGTWIFGSDYTTTENNTYTGNTTINNGGAIQNSGVLTVDNSTLVGNGAGGRGGALEKPHEQRRGESFVSIRYAAHP